MNQSRIPVIGFVLAALSTAGQAVDLKAIATPNFSAVTAEVASLVRSEGAKHVLVVYDIDNTMLATAKDLGSEHWFLWQRGLIEQGVKKSPAVATSVEDLLSAQSWVYKIGQMHPVAREIPSQIQAQRSRGVSVIALTSRNPSLRDSSLEEIQRNNINLSPSREFGVHDLAEPFLPYDLKQPERSGLTREDVERFKLGEARPVVFDRGVMLTQGQHKGVMLKNLLARTAREFAGIVFVDDRESHIEGMRAAFADRPEKMVTILYNKQAPVIKAFNESDKRASITDWCKIYGTVTTTILTKKETTGLIRCS